MESDPSSGMGGEMKLVDLSGGEESVIKDVETDVQVSLSKVGEHGYRIESVSVRQYRLSGGLDCASHQASSGMDVLS